MSHAVYYNFSKEKDRLKLFQVLILVKPLLLAQPPDDSAKMIHRMFDDETIVWGQVAGRSINDYT